MIRCAATGNTDDLACAGSHDYWIQHFKRQFWLSLCFGTVFCCLSKIRVISVTSANTLGHI